MKFSRLFEGSIVKGRARHSAALSTTEFIDMMDTAGVIKPRRSSTGDKT